VNKLPNIESIKKQMNELAKKRNQIVHEGDLVRHERGGHTRLNKITYKYVQDSIGFLKNLVDTIEKIKP
jgi:hypothetical protein